MRRKWIALALAVCLAAAAAAGAEGTGVDWTAQQRAVLRVGNTTPLSGRFFTTLWGGTTSDLDVQDLLHGFSLARYSLEGSQFLFDTSVVQDAAAVDDADGARTYYIVLYDDLKWSDGTPITAKDYAFSILFRMDPAIAEAGGRPADYSWMDGADAYTAGESRVLSGLRVIGDDILQVKVCADALPYFYELSRFVIHPYPAAVLAPGFEVKDEGDGAFLSAPLTADLIRQTVLDPETGYLAHPSVVSGPYTLDSFENGAAKFTINPYYKGNEEGVLPRIGELEYTRADNSDMMARLGSGDFELLNKVTLSESIREGLQGSEDLSCTVSNYPRTGLTMLWFMENSLPMQDPAVRTAIARSFDREEFTLAYAGPFGMKMDGFYGLGQWMYRLASGTIGAPADEEMTEEEKAAEERRFSELTLDGLTIYDPDPEAAADTLEKAGWVLSSEGIRSRKTEGTETELRLTLGMPENAEAKAALEQYLGEPLRETGIALEIQTLTMEEIGKAYRGETDNVDLLYLGEDFSIRFDPEILRPQAENAAGSLTAAKAELYGMAQEMVRTAPGDLYGFMEQWIALQEKITQTLPLLPVYSNIYFDFATRQLHDYSIIEAVTWSEAIVRSYMSDAEDLAEIDKQTLLHKLEDLEMQFNKRRPNGVLPY